MLVRIAEAAGARIQTIRNTLIDLSISLEPSQTYVVVGLPISGAMSLSVAQDERH
jgi:putative heme iron utilization protein